MRPLGTNRTNGVGLLGRRGCAAFAKTDHFISCSNFRASPSNSRICLRSAIAFLVNRPCRRAFRFLLGAPDPGAPPCIRQRLLPRSAGERHDPPERILAPQRGLASIGPVLGA
jgi:hypothetical protein